MSTAKPQVHWNVTVDEYAKVPDTILKPGGRYRLTVTNTELQFIPTVSCGSKCCAKMYALPLSKIASLWEVPAEYSLKGLVIQLLDEGIAEDETPSQPYHKLWVEGSEEMTSACANKIQSMRRLRQGHVIVSGFLDSLTNVPVFFPATVGVQIFKAFQNLRTSAVGASESIAVEGGTVKIECMPFGIEALFTPTPTPEDDGRDKTSSVFVENVEGPVLALKVVEEVYKPEDGSKPYKRYSLVKPGSETKAKVKYFNLESTTILEAQYVAGLGGKAPESKSRSRMPSRSRQPSGSKKEKDGNAPTVMGRIKRGLSLKKSAPPPAPAPEAAPTS